MKDDEGKSGMRKDGKKWTKVLVIVCEEGEGRRRSTETERTPKTREREKGTR